MKKIVILVSLLVLKSCETFMTRTDVKDYEQKKQMQDQVVNLQKNNADVSSRFSDIESELRSLNGRIDVLEDKLAKSNSDKEKLREANNDSGKKIQLLQEEMARLEKDNTALSTELNNVKSAVAAGLSAPSLRESSERESPKEKKGPYAIAEELFEKKDFKKAALSYQKFKEANPKSKLVADATYKMGVCFQELGLMEDAKAFFEEVISKHPDSPEAKRAKTRLKSLKK